MSESTPSHDQLPLPDYDHLPIGSLAGHLRSLDAAQLEGLLSYERAHASRLAVVQLMEHRLEELRQGAQPSGGSPDAAHPETAAPPTPADNVDKASPATQGPKINPPSQGDPTNPAQPRT